MRKFLQSVGLRILSLWWAVLLVSSIAGWAYFKSNITAIGFQQSLYDILTAGTQAIWAVVVQPTVFVSLIILAAISRNRDIIVRLIEGKDIEGKFGAASLKISMHDAEAAAEEKIQSEVITSSLDVALAAEARPEEAAVKPVIPAYEQYISSLSSTYREVLLKLDGPKNTFGQIASPFQEILEAANKKINEGKGFDELSYKIFGLDLLIQFLDLLPRDVGGLERLEEKDSEGNQLYQFKLRSGVRDFIVRQEEALKK